MITSSTAHNNFIPRHTPPYASLPPCQINECANIGVHHKPLSNGDITKSKTPHPIYGSVLSVNIRDFSIFSSQLTGEELIEFTNVFFDQTYKPIHQQHGWVVRFFDDEITAMFEPGAGQPDDHAERALKVALLIVLAAESFRKWITQRFPKRKLPEFSVGIGIHSGEATICNTSNGAAMETNLTGDTVDIAAHLHAMTKTLGWSIATSSTCTNIVGDRFQINRDNMIILKGKKLPFQAIEITGLNPQKATTRNDIFFYEKLGQAVAINTAIIESAQKQTNKAQHNFTNTPNTTDISPQDRPIEVEGYRLLRKLGSGGMSEIFLAENLITHTQQVLKLIPTTHLGNDNDNVLQRFLHEFALVSQIDHPNVARIYHQGFTATHAYISMEFFPGGDLRCLISKQPSPQVAIASLLQILSGLSAIHALGIIHCDIKPDNVMIRQDGSLALADFGIAEHTNSIKLPTRPGEIMGSPSYLAPEQALDLPIGQQADIYSAGAIFYEMLTSQPPYKGSSVQAILYQHVNLPVPVLPTDVERFQPLLNRMMAKSATARFENADAAIEYLISSGLIEDL